MYLGTSVLILLLVAALTTIAVGQAQELAHLKVACQPELRGSI